MRALIYQGPAGRRVLGTEDGLDTERRFTRGVALEVSEADANRILSGPHADEFIEGEAPEPADKAGKSADQED